jgi:2-iminobutanoate/2-iminopropanoate deaminase
MLGIPQKIRASPRAGKTGVPRPAHLSTERPAKELPMPLKPFCAALSAVLALSLAAPAQAEIVRIKRNPAALILEAARVNAGADVIYVSGQLPSPIDPAKPMSEVKSLADMGDTRTQTISTLAKIKDVLATQGFTMADVVKLTLFVVADPATGKMDFAGVNEGFKAFFGTAENPNTVARSTFEVAGLVGPHYLIEIEAIAAKAPVPAR